MKAEVKVSTAIASHLSDIQFELDYEQLRGMVNRKLNFIKKLVAAFPNTNVTIEADVLDGIWAETT